MEPISAILTALAIGAAAGAQGTASAAVGDLYSGLKGKFAERLSRRRAVDATDALTSYANEAKDGPPSEPTEGLLRGHLLAASIHEDRRAADQARAVLNAIGNYEKGQKYAAYVHDSKAVQIGDNNTQIANFNS